MEISLKSQIKQLHASLSAVYTENPVLRKRILDLIAELRDIEALPDDEIEARKEALYERLVEERDQLIGTPLEKTGIVNQIKQIGARLRPESDQYSPEEIKRSLESIDHELSEIASGADHERDVIERVRFEIKQFLDPDLGDDVNSLREQFDAALILFEENHPRIATAIRRAINILSLSGV